MPEFQLYTDEEGSVTALYNTALDGENAGESFSKSHVYVACIP